MFDFLYDFALQFAQSFLVMGGAVAIGTGAMLGLKFLAKGVTSVVEALKE